MARTKVFKSLASTTIPTANMTANMTTSSNKSDNKSFWLEFDRVGTWDPATRRVGWVGENVRLPFPPILILAHLTFPEHKHNLTYV